MYGSVRSVLVSVCVCLLKNGQGGLSIVVQQAVFKVLALGTEEGR